MLWPLSITGVLALFASGFFLLVAGRSAKAEPLRLTMEQAVERALQSNLELRAASQDVEVAAAGLERSSAWLPSNPFFSVGASRRAETGGRPNYFAFLSQEFEVGGQRIPRRTAASHNVEQERANLRQKQLALVADVKSTFVRALVQRERAKFISEQIDLAQRLVRAATLQHLTVAERIESNQARLQVTRYQRELWVAEREMASQIDALRRHLNIEREVELELEGSVASDLPVPVGPTELVRAAAANRPDVQAFEHALAAADAQIEVIKRERIPNVTVSGSYSRFENNDFGGGDVGVALPLFQTKSADLQEATAQRVRLSAQLEDVRRQAEREVLEAYRAYELARREADLFRSTLLPLAEENARLQEQLRRRDEASDADVWNQKIDLLEIRKDYVETLQSLHLARFDLERAVGGQLPIPPTTFPTPGN